jgi:hypothetical protein
MSEQAVDVRRLRVVRQVVDLDVLAFEVGASGLRGRGRGLSPLDGFGAVSSKPMPVRPALPESWIGLTMPSPFLPRP